MSDPGVLDLERMLRSLISFVQRSAEEDQASERTLHRVMAMLWAAYDELELLGPDAASLRKGMGARGRDPHVALGEPVGGHAVGR